MVNENVMTVERRLGRVLSGYEPIPLSRGKRALTGLGGVIKIRLVSLLMASFVKPSFIFSHLRV